MVSYFRLTLGGNFQVNIGVFHINIERGGIDLQIRAGTKVTGLRNHDISFDKVKGYFKVKSL